MSVNLDGAFFTLRTAARHMVERGGGVARRHLVALGDVAPREPAHMPPPRRVISLMRAWR